MFFLCIMISTRNTVVNNVRRNNYIQKVLRIRFQCILTVKDMVTPKDVGHFRYGHSPYIQINSYRLEVSCTGHICNKVMFSNHLETRCVH